MSDESIDPPAQVEPAIRPGPPPLRIHHILLATVVIAILLSDNEWLQQKSELAVLSQYRRSIVGMVQTINTGLAVTAVMLGLWWRREGRAFFNLPGHWLLVYGALAIWGLVFIALSAVLRLSDDGESYVTIERWFIVFFMLSIAIVLWAGFRVADTSLWKTWFVFTGSWWLAMWALRWFGGDDLMMPVSTAVTLATTIVLLAAAVGDRRARRGRNWPHWLGVVLALITSATWLVQSAWSWIVG